MNTITCPECGHTSNRFDQRVSTPGRCYYELRDGKVSDIGADSDWNYSDFTEFLCVECGEDLPDDVQAALKELVNQ